MIITASNDRIMISDYDLLADQLLTLPGAYGKGKFISLPRSPFSLARCVRIFRKSQATPPGAKLRMDRTCHSLMIQFESMLDPEQQSLEWRCITDPWLPQERAARYLSVRESAYLALWMGNGKTAVIIHKVAEVRPWRTLVVAPKSVMDVWADEFKKHWDKYYGDYVVVVADGATNEKKLKQLEELGRLTGRGARCGIFVVNYESMWRGRLATEILKTDWGMVVYDEAHKLKAPGGRASRFAYRLWKAGAGSGRLVYLLSGTPIPNNPSDLYAQYRAMDPGVFGTSAARFRARYCVMGGFQNHEIVGWRNQEEMESLLNLSMIRIGKEDGIGLPALTHATRYVDLPPAVRREYEGLKKGLIMQLDEGEVTPSTALVALLRMQQVTGGGVHTDDGILVERHQEKMRALMDLIEGVDKGEPIVVFCRFKHDLVQTRNAAHALRRKYLEVSGEHNGLEGGRIPEGFGGVLGVQIASGGVGVNLNAARYGVFFSHGFSLAEYDQAVSRLHRGGQKRPVLFTHILAKNTIDIDVLHAIQAKRDIVEEILGGLKDGK